MRNRCRLGAIICILVLIEVRLAAADIGMWAYDLPRWSEGQWAAKAGALPAGTRHLFASLEEGPRFLLEEEFRAAEIQRLVGFLRESFGIAVYALILQDTRWLDNPEGAVQRVDRVLRLNGLRPDQAFVGVHVNVEPQTLEEWECGGLAVRRGLVQKLLGLLARIRQAIATHSPPVPGGKERLLVSAALPWWIGSLSAEIPEASPGRWLEHLDELVLMAYGDPGGPVVGGSARALLTRLEDGRLWQSLPAGKGIRIGLATYEYANGADLLAVSRELDRVLGRRPGYRGTAIFHHGGGYGAPLVASLRGLVRDPEGRPVVRARVKIGDRQTATNRCGRFVFRDLPYPRVELQVGGMGLQSLTVPVSGLAPGREIEIPPVTVYPRP